MKLNLNRESASLLIQIKEQTGNGFSAIMSEALEQYYKKNVANKQQANNEVYNDQNSRSP
jgi:hypothetical protein